MVGDPLERRATYSIPPYWRERWPTGRRDLEAALAAITGHFDHDPLTEHVGWCVNCRDTGDGCDLTTLEDHPQGHCWCPIGQSRARRERQP